MNPGQGNVVVHFTRKRWIYLSTGSIQTFRYSCYFSFFNSRSEVFWSNV